MAAPGRVAVAASGGRDSTALLHCTAKAAAALGIEAVALHVHHGLMPEADAWLAAVRRQAGRWGADFAFRRLEDTPAAGDSVEAWARRGRHAALAAMAVEAGCNLVLLAHHRRDQAETVLLQALRGGGPAGLAAMPRSAVRDGIVWARPWLRLPREAIEAYVRRHRLRHAEDASNADPRFARSRMRLQVWPGLAAAFEGAETALCRAAGAAQQAAALAAEVAADDLPGLLDGSSLRLPPWAALPPARRRNALHAWLAQALAGPVTGSLVERLTRELHGMASGRWPAAPGVEVRAHRGRLSAHPVAMAAPAPVGVPGGSALPLDLSRPGRVALPAWGGHFEIENCREGGVAPALLDGARPQRRAGGERFALAPAGSARSLKKQYQAQGVPAWGRDGPLLYAADGRLLFVPGLGTDARVRAVPGTPQRRLRWVPELPPAAPASRAGVGG